MKVLPTYPGPKSAALRPIDAGGWQEAVLGGDDIRLDRLGDRFGLAVTMPPMKWNTIDGQSAARIWAARLNQGISEGVRLEVPQPDFDTSGFDFQCVPSATAAQASVVAVTSAGANKVYPEGALVTVQKSGRHYLHQLTAEAVMDGAGAGSLSIWPRLRVSINQGTGDDRILLRTPLIEGRLVDPQPFDMTEIRTIGVAFDVQEIG